MKTLDELQVVFGRMREAYFFANGLPDGATDDLFTVADFAMPISEDGVNFEFGAPDITKEKITEGRVWYTFAQSGDSDISLQVPSLHEDVNALFLTKVSTAAITKKAGGKTYSGHGYSTTPKKVSGAWVFCNPEHDLILALPKTDNYANLVGATGDAKGYYNVAVTPMKDKDGAEVIILRDSTAVEP